MKKFRPISARAAGAQGAMGAEVGQLPDRVPGRRCVKLCVFILRSALAPHVLKAAGPIFSPPDPKM
jgi:hypothetical protein